jgi:hypothetical protein
MLKVVEDNMEGTVAKMPEASERVEQGLIDGDLSVLRPEERLNLYRRVCESLGLNPLTKPFAYIRLNNKLTLYALKDCTDQLRTIHGISITLPKREVIDGVYVVTAQGQRADGRQDESTGAVPIEGLKGEAKANAMMKAETKAKRRVTLSICGLGMLDESEVSSIPDAQVEPQNTPEEQAQLAQRRIEETKHETADVPAPLKALFDNLDKPGYVKQGYTLLKNRLMELQPAEATGEAEYKRICDTHDVRSTTQLKVHKAALLEMWEVSEVWQQQKEAIRQAELGITDADVPTAQGSLL